MSTRPRLETRPSLPDGSPAPSTLPSAVPFRAPGEGEMISNGAAGTYFMGEHIGSGSFGDVYECTDEWANALVAKVLKPGAPFHEVKQQWEREVGNLARLRHPNITYIHDAFIYNNAFYIIVEKCLYSLDRILPRVDATWVPHIARDILQALAFVHRHGHVHKDVHPGNVFVSLTNDVISTESGSFLQFKLGDLGIAREEHSIRTTGTILAPWMQPPEAVDPARYGQVSKPTDVYHCALLLLAVLRRSIYQFSQVEILQGRPQELAAQTGSPFAAALNSALQPEVRRRTQTPLEFWREIQAASLLAGTTDPPRPTG
ncbi:MAG: serine/threonine-protein kinase [Nannocystaceae bacterium]|nr:serine/threonine-protein kinase [Nannocystaceae bacterium]